MHTLAKQRHVLITVGPILISLLRLVFHGSQGAHDIYRLSFSRGFLEVGVCDAHEDVVLLSYISK